MASEANAGSQCGGDSTAPKAVANTCVTPPSDAASAGGPAVQTWSQESQSMPHNSQTIHSIELKAPGKKKIRNIPYTLLQCSTPDTKLNSITKCMLTGVGCRILDHAQAIPRRQTFMVEIISHPLRRQTRAVGRTPRRTQKVRNSTPDEAASRITIGEPSLLRRTGSRQTVQKIPSTRRDTRSTRDCRNKNVPTMNPFRSRNTTRNPNTAQGSNTRQTPIASRNPI